MSAQKVVLETSDHVSIAGTYARGDAAGAVLLLHMMPATKESWKLVVATLDRSGIATLAIDLRGHGASDGGPDGYKTFTDDMHRKSARDVKAAMDFLSREKYHSSQCLIIGASIGANLAVQYAASHDVRGIALLSPGFSYRGLDIRPLMGHIKEGTHVFFAGSEDDTRSYGNCATMARVLRKGLMSRVASDIIIYQHAGHGTDMCGVEAPDLTHTLELWSKKLIL